MKKWETLESKIAFDNKWFKVRQDKVKISNSKVLDDYYVWLQGDVSLVVPVTKNNEFILVRQYKHGVGDFIIEYPAGFIEENEVPLIAAQRELLEETGYTGDNFLKLSEFTESPAKVVGKTYVFLVQDVVWVGQQNLDDSEEIEVLSVPWQEVLEMVITGKIWATPSVAATFMALEKLGLRGK